MNLDIPEEVHRAERLIRPYILHTPLLPSVVLGGGHRHPCVGQAGEQAAYRLL